MGLKEAGLRGSLRSVSTGVRAIPDSVVSREDDDTTGTSDQQLGVIFNSTESWTDIGARISQNSSGFTRAYLYDVDDRTNDLVDDKDISNLSALDTVTFESVNLGPDTDYAIVLDAEGASYNPGRFDDANFPYSSNDGILEMVTGWNATSESEVPDNHNILEIGNVGFD